MNQTPSTASAPLTQRSRPWNDEELERLRAYADRPASRLALMRDFPDRTLGAVRVQLGKLRRVGGIPKHQNVADNLSPATIAPAMLDPKDPGCPSLWLDDWREAAAVANQRYLSAVLRLAA